MRTALPALLLPLLVFACSKDPDTHVSVDAGDRAVDARQPIDAPVDARPDAAPDAPNMDVVTACMHACAALGVCVGQAPDAECQDGCQTDLADCTTEQVATIDACSTQDCGDLENNMSPLLDCITGVSCVSLATMRPPSK
jgi:hypothetical protein